MEILIIVIGIILVIPLVLRDVQKASISIKKIIEDEEEKERIERNQILNTASKITEIKNDKKGKKIFNCYDKFFCEYNSTRLIFKKKEIDKIDINGIIIINVVNENQNLTYQISKIDFILNFQNVINSKAYLEKGNYKYTAIPKHFEKYLVSDNSLLAKDIKLDDIYKIMDFNSLNSHLIKQILDETIREKKYPKSYFTKERLIVEFFYCFIEPWRLNPEMEEEEALHPTASAWTLKNLTETIIEFENNNMALIGHMMFRDYFNLYKFYMHNYAEFTSEDGSIKHYKHSFAKIEFDSEIEEKMKKIKDLKF